MLERRSFSLAVYMPGDAARFPLGTIDFGFDAKGMVQISHTHGRDPPKVGSMVVVPYSSLEVVIDAFLNGNFKFKRILHKNRDFAEWSKYPMIKVILYRRKGQAWTDQILVQKWTKEAYDELPSKFMQLISFAQGIQS
jgi:hypothetical protein